MFLVARQKKYIFASIQALIKVKVKGFTLEFLVRSISPEPLDRFSWNFTQMFLLVRRCAEYMTQLRRLKVTGQGQMIYPWILCLLHISWTL